MISINSYLHRRELNDIIERWMYHEIRPIDADRMLRLVHFNNIYVYRYLDYLSRRLFHALYQSEPFVKRVSTKGELKDALVASPSYRNTRINELIGIYNRYPGDFYRETPFYGALVFLASGDSVQYVGSYRMKRVRRLAEKTARRIVDRIFDAIKRHADTLADARAEQLGVPREQLVTPPDEMTEEFLQAESRLLEDLRNRQPIHEIDDIRISDVAGLKIIWEEDADLGVLVRRLQGMDCQILEEETHRGKYNATNLIVRFQPPKDLILSKPLSNHVLAMMQARGLNHEQCLREYADFVKSGEKSADLEIIVSSYQETLESEIGRCMHEDRIIAQRLHRPYRGHLAKNVEYLMEYLFTFPESARKELDELPIRLWDRYLPDYFFEVMKDLFQIPSHGPLD